jgi:dipeptidyl aminopeptidase/acylaminoacyl peptidase
VEIIDVNPVPGWWRRQWSLDSKSLYLLSENLGSVLPYHLSHPGHLPTPLLFNGSTSSLVPLPSSKLLIQRSSLISPPESYILTIPEFGTDISKDQDGDGDKTPATTLEQVTMHSEKGLKGKHLSPGEKFWFKGTEGQDVMGWMVKPKGWKAGEKKKWPMGELEVEGREVLGGDIDAMGVAAQLS